MCRSHSQAVWHMGQQFTCIMSHADGIIKIQLHAGLCFMCMLQALLGPCVPPHAWLHPSCSCEQLTPSTPTCPNTFSNTWATGPARTPAASDCADSLCSLCWRSTAAANHAAGARLSEVGPSREQLWHRHFFRPHQHSPGVHDAGGS